MAASPERTRWIVAAALGVVGALVVGIVVLAFVWPAATATARNLPVGISGPDQQVDAVRTSLSQQASDPFDLVTVDSRADAVRRIERRELYGAVLLGESPEVLTSSAASSVSNQALRGLATGLQQQLTARGTAALAAALQRPGVTPEQLRTVVGSTPTVRVTDVVALSADDPNGAGLAGASFPLVLGGMLGGVLVSLLVVGAARRVLALLVYGAAAGTTTTLVLQTWLHVLQRDWLVNAAAFALAMTATAAVVVGFSSLIDQAGIGLGAVISLLVGNPISGATLPYQFIAEPWGVVGQYFVPGAASSLVRSLSYFPLADTGMQWLVLGSWAVGGLLLTIVGHFRGAASIREPEGTLERAA